MREAWQLGVRLDRLEVFTTASVFDTAIAEARP
jgi:hypothetical protein